MKKFTYETYELLSIQNPEQFNQDFGEFIDMENPADLQYQVDFDEQYGIAAKSEDADDLICWPVYLSREQQAEAMGNDSKIIEAEGFELEEEEEEK